MELIFKIKELTVEKLKIKTLKVQVLWTSVFAILTEVYRTKVQKKW